jgi:hypothetical protein
VKIFPYRLEAYWDGIEEPLVAPVARLASFLEDLSTSVPDAAPWFVDEGDGLTRWDEHEPVRHLLAVATTNRETWLYGEQELAAYPLYLTNARRRAKGVRVAAKFGHRPSDVGIWFADRVVVDLWAPREGFEELTQLVGVFDALCRTFQPLWACGGPADWPLRDLSEELTGVPKVSWFVYLREQSAPSLLAAGVDEETIGSVDRAPGQRLVAVKEWFELAESTHVERVETLRQQLAGAGALAPRTRPPG